jgi:hypothetical protein
VQQIRKLHTCHFSKVSKKKVAWKPGDQRLVSAYALAGIKMKEK